jgi:ATP-dependent Zn proteases
MGPAKKSRLVTEADKRIVAYHEAGHAIVSKVCDTLTVHGVTIVPRGRAGGFTSYMPKNDNTFSSKQQMFDQITMALGGRAAEEIILASITQGASGDINSSLVLHMKW